MNLRGRTLASLLILCFFLVPAGRADAPAVDSLLAAKKAGQSLPMLRARLDSLRQAEPAQASLWDLLELRFLSEMAPLALEEQLQAFRRKWPDSRYLDWAEWYGLRSQVRLGEERSAVIHGLDLLAERVEPSLEPRMRAQLLALLNAGLPQLAGRSWLPPLDDRREAVWQSLRQERLPRRRIGLVLPLRGRDGALGRIMEQGALELLARHPEAAAWDLRIRDCESDPLIARRQCVELQEQGVDAILLPGLPRYAAAAAATGKAPKVFPWVENTALLPADPTFYQFNSLPESRLQTLFEWAADSLGIRQAISLTPADREGRELETRLTELALERGIELGQPQRYLPGMKDMRRQADNLSLYASAFDSSDAMLIFARAGDMEVLIPQLAGAGPAGWILSDASFMEGLGKREMASYRDSLLLATDWLPSPSFPLWKGYLDDQRDSGRSFQKNEALVFESLRLLLDCGELAHTSGSSFEQVLSGLDLPSAFGGRLRLVDRANATTLPVLWDGRRFRSIGSAR